MFRLIKIASLSSLVLVALVGTGVAQTWTAEQQEIWKLEEQQWQMAQDKDSSWIDTMVHDNLSYWDTAEAMPQSKASLARWNRYGNSIATTLEHELFPIALTITGNIAVAQYRYRTAVENYKKERGVVFGHYTDVLLKEGGTWRFIAWAGGEDSKN